MGLFDLAILFGISPVIHESNLIERWDNEEEENREGFMTKEILRI